MASFDVQYVCFLSVPKASVLMDQPGDPQFWPRQNFIFFYGYLVGSETFVGNWRFAALDPSLPTWESAFVMSRRKDDDDAHETG